MANITILPGSARYQENFFSGGRERVFSGKGTFNGTDTSDTLAVKFLDRITGAFFNPIGAAASDGIPSLSDTMAANGDIVLGAARIVTVQRPAGTTSNLMFDFRLVETIATTTY